MFLVWRGRPPRRARGKLPKRITRIRGGNESRRDRKQRTTSPGAPGSNEQQPIMSDRCSVVSCALERQAGPASEDSCSKFQMLNAKCPVLNALHPRYPRRRFTPCAPGRFFYRAYQFDDGRGPRISPMTRIRETASKVHGLCVIRLIRVIGGGVNERSGSGNRIGTTGPRTKTGVR